MKRWIAAAVLLLCAGLACTKPTVQNEGETSMKEQVFPVQQITDTFAWIDHTAAELAIDAAYIDEFDNIRFTCDLFGHSVNGTARVRGKYASDGQPYTVHEITLYDDVAYRQTTEDGLKVLYGEPYAEGMDPYVASNGGAVYWTKYWTGEGVIQLSSGMAHSFYTFSYRVTEMPEEIKKQLAGLTPRELMYRTGVLFEFADGEIEDLRIQPTTYEGYEAYEVTFLRSGRPVSALVAKDATALFDTFKNDGADWTERTDLPLVKSICTVREDGSGQVVQKVLDLLWIIDADAPATVESLQELETFLINHWLNK